MEIDFNHSKGTHETNCEGVCFTAEKVIVRCTIRRWIFFSLFCVRLCQSLMVSFFPKSAFVSTSLSLIAALAVLNADGGIPGSAQP